MSEKNCLYVGSRGILKSCDVYKDPPVSSTADLPDLDKIQENSTVYICTTAIPNFVKNLDNIKHRFILVSGDADEEVFKQVFESKDDFITFVENDKIVHWFAQNCVSVHDKITNLPIGLDYHSLAKNASSHGEQKSPSEQEKLLINIKNKCKPFYQRENKCYLNFVYPPDVYHYSFDRKEALAELNKDLLFKEKDNEKRETCWQNQTSCAFVISPFGNGMDCHRTWEALVLGCIPIVRFSGMNPLFDELPVLIIDKWSDVTQELLDKTVNEFKDKTFNYEKLKLQYWTDKINSYKEKESFIEMGCSNNYWNWIFYLFMIIFILLFLILFVKKTKSNKPLFKFLKIF